MLTIRNWKPSQISANSLREFTNLLRDSVPLKGTGNGTYKLATRAKSIVGLYDNGNGLVGGIGVKVPRRSWRAKISDRSAVALPELELGWLFIKPAYAGQGGGEQLIEAAVCAANGAPLYYIANTSHTQLHSLLRRFGFVPKGRSFNGECGGTLQVWLKSASGASPCGGASSGCSSPTHRDIV